MDKMYKILKKPFFGRYMGAWNNPLDRQERRSWRRCNVTNAVGVRLSGLYFRTASARATIVLGHPMGKEAKGFFIRRGYADFLVRNGFNVFVFDFNGFGESETGDFDYPQDILAVGQKVKELIPDLPIGYLGVSMGASWGICALSQPDHVYSAAVFDSAFTTVDEFWKKYLPAYITLKVLGTLMPRKKDRLHVLTKVGQIKGLTSARFICCRQDDVTPLEMTLRLKERCNIETDLFVVNGSRHTMAYQSNPSAYEHFICDYFNRELVEKQQEAIAV
jgi:alpha/beta superfamily hydrolase